MKRSFEDWMNGTEPEAAPKAPEPEKFYDYDQELPHDVDFGDAPGTYIYRCRGCHNWCPMDWELSEDHPDSHYCGRDQWCCPCKPTEVWLKHKKMVEPGPVRGKPKAKIQPTTAKAMPPPSADRFQCPGCMSWHPISRACMTHDGQMWCGSYGCVPEEKPKKPRTLDQIQREAQQKHEYEARVRAGMPTASQAQEAYNQLRQTCVCEGCNMRLPLEHAPTHPFTKRPFCGDRYCHERIYQHARR